MNPRSLLLLALLLTGVPRFAGGQTYRIGDVITNPNDNSKGVVFWINPERTGGWMVALRNDERKCKMKAINIRDGELPGMLKNSYDTAGYYNTVLLRPYMEDDQYAVQNTDLRNGWYLPAIGQLQSLYAVRAAIEPVLMACGGDPLASTTRYWSSSYLPSYIDDTVTGFNPIYINLTNGIGDSYIKPSGFVRAVRSFSIPRSTASPSTYRWNTGETTPAISPTPARTTTYTVAATNREGCSSSDSRQVFVASGPGAILRDTIRRGETYRRNGFCESEPGTYTHTVSGPGGCDMTLTLVLEVLEPIAPTVFRETTCEGTVYSGHNFTVWDAGTYTQQWLSADGRDSAVVLHLSVLPSYHHTLGVTLCPGGRYDINGTGISTPGTYVFPLRTAAGCDSVITLNLAELPAYLFPSQATICQGETYEFRGRNLTAAGVYHDSLKTATGCDSVYRLELSVNPTYHPVINAEICQGDTYAANGFSTSTPGTHTLTLRTAAGCDSTVTLHLSVSPTYLLPSQATICQGETYEFRGRNLTEAGIYHDSLKTAAGCDSVYRLVLNVNPVYHPVINAEICQGDTYAANGFSTSTPGTHTLSLRTAAGCDSTVTLHLAVNPSYLFPSQATICQGEIHEFRGRNLTEAGVYHDSLKTAAGCDSVYRLVLNVNPVYHPVINAEICQGDIYKDNGFSTSTPGTHTHSLRTAAGCDSTVTLHLSVSPTYLLPSQATICQGETYEFRGKSLAAAGIYHDSLRTAAGCDSVYRLVLNVNPTYRQVIQATICQGEVYEFRGRRLTEAGIYHDSLKTAAGCDSIYRLKLKVHNYFQGRIVAGMDDCSTRTYRFQAVSDLPDDGTVRRYAWSSGKGDVSHSQETRWSYPDSGTYHITLKVATDGGCDQELEHVLRVPYLPRQAEIFADPAAITRTSRKISLWACSYPGITYEWDLGDGTTGKGHRIEHTYGEDGQDSYEIRLTMTSPENCMAEGALRLQTDRSLIIPNTFSPNHDGINDVFMSGFRVKIMDRNGKMVYEGNEGWDGLYKGQPAAEDTYFYSLYYSNARGEQKTTGFITLMR